MKVEVSVALALSASLERKIHHEIKLHPADKDSLDFKQEEKKGNFPQSKVGSGEQSYTEE